MAGLAVYFQEVPASAADLAERRRVEAAAAHLAGIVTSAEDAIASKTLDGIVTSWNASAERMFGYTAQEMIGQPITRLFPPDRLKEEDLILARIRAGERIEHFETVRVTKDDRHLDVSLTISPIRDSAGTIIGASKIVRDITERKRIETALRESEEKFRTLADNIPTLAWMAHADGHIFWYNRRWYDYTGTTRESQEGWGWQSVHDPDELPRVVERWKQTLATGEPFEMVFPLRGADGVFRPFLTRIVPVNDEQGRVVRWFGTSTDVSDLRAAEEALRAANRRMDEFLHTATHELKTPLTAVQANLQLVERRLQRLLTAPSDAPTPTEREALQVPAQLVARSQQQVRRLTRLVDDLLDAARIQAGKLEIRPAPCDLAEIVWDAVTEQQAVRPERTIRLELAGPQSQPVPVEADPDRIGQVVTNYLTNALKYSPDESPVEVALRVEGDTARVSVRDQGPGIPPEEQLHVWERGHRVPGIQPTSNGVGLGLGLHISREIVERHGGAVGVESAPGAGSTFWFTLPLAARA
jgi:PAS domain S-box-containing protein